jgi:hypothetical protein
MDIQSMMQVEMEEEESSSSSSYRTTETLKKQRKTLEDKFSEEPAPRRTPRRAAAQAAANTIKVSVFAAVGCVNTIIKCKTEIYIYQTLKHFQA